MCANSNTDLGAKLAVLPTARSSTFVRRPKAESSDDELRLLDEWLDNPNQKIAILLADGGIGKTTIARKWLTSTYDAADEHARKTTAKYKLVVHSFYGQAQYGTSIVDVAINTILEGIEGHRASVPSQKVRIDRIVSAAEQEPLLLVLDGLETQQDSDGFIDAKSLPMDDLITRLAATKNCKILVTSRQPLHLFGNATITTIDVKDFSKSQISKFLELELVVDSETADSYSTVFFPDRSAPLLVSIFIDLVKYGVIKTHKETIRLALGSTSNKQNPEGILDLFQILKEGMSERSLDVLWVLATSDVPLDIETITTFLIEDSCASSALDEFSRLHISLEIGEGSFDLHPRIRHAVSEILRREDLGTYRRLRRQFAEYLEAKAENVVENPSSPEDYNFQRLSYLYRSLHFWLESDEPMRGLTEVYIEKLGNDTVEGLRKGPGNWRSIRKEFAYRYEDAALSRILLLVGSLDHLEDMYRLALYRHSLVARALGDIPAAQKASEKLSEFEFAQRGESDATAQVILTQLMKGAVDLPHSNRNGASYWVQRTEELTKSISDPMAALFPSLRYHVYTGAYYHRLNDHALAKSHFEQALENQRLMHEADPTRPKALVGLNAFLQSWFLIESGEINVAYDAAKDCQNYIDVLLEYEKNSELGQQWKLMATVTETWAAQEYANLAASIDKDASRNAFRRAELLLEELEELETNGEFRVPFDLEVVHIRSKARMLAMKGDPQASVELLAKQSQIYERRGVGLYAADCQADALRTFRSHLDLDINWVLPKPVALQDLLLKLIALTEHYPLGRVNWLNMPTLKRFA